jgi:hypothetical protein
MRDEKREVKRRDASTQRQYKARGSPTIPERGAEAVSFRPELITWWNLLCRWTDHLQQCHRWLATDHPPPPVQHHVRLEQRSIPTFALCLAGRVRVESMSETCDLAPGEALLIAPGAWYHHAQLRPGTVVYRQGVIFRRSDFFLMNADLHLVATIPEQPSRRMMEEALREADPDRRRAKLSALLATAVNEVAKPRPLLHPSVLAMHYALQNTLHLRDGTAAAVRASGLSRAQAYRWFRSAMGAGIATIRRQQRQELSEWLRLEGLPPREIARRCWQGTRKK